MGQVESKRNADAWLTSDVFDLDETGSLEAEAALEKARALLLLDQPDLAAIHEADKHLQAAPSATDRFWMRWSAWRDLHIKGKRP
ncbi:MAG: hypothetical protein AAFX99_19140 [Myxococcota bacterium]